MRLCPIARIGNIEEAQSIRHIFRFIEASSKAHYVGKFLNACQYQYSPYINIFLTFTFTVAVVENI